MTEFVADYQHSAGYDVLVKRLTNFGLWTDGVIRDTVDNDIRPAILPEAQVEPGPVAKPIVWNSAKQRRYVMMKIRKGEIPSPYVRSHALSQGWAMTTESRSGYTEINMGNSAPHFTFVEGKTQQIMHSNTGWLSAPDKIPVWTDRVIVMCKDGLQAAWGQEEAAG